MPRLTVTLLGGFEVLTSLGRLLAVPTKKAQALLAYLALTPGQTHPRDQLAALLWPDAPPGRARNALRQTLFVLRKALGAADGELLVMTADAITLPSDAVQTDVAAFEQAAAVGTPAALQDAAGLYRGDLLAGLGVDEPTFEDWLMSERERLRELALEALAKLLAHQRAVGATASAVQSAIRLLALDPLQEAVHRALMRCYAQRGRRDAALRQYQDCVEVLRRELDVEPEPETKELYREILRQRPVRVATMRAAPGASEAPLVGRDTEVGRLHEALAEAWAGHGCVVALLGEAGIGKTRLLAELAAEAERRKGSVLLGRAYESERFLPFGPWVGAIRDAGVLTDPRAVDGLSSGSRVELARLFPELAEGSPLAPSPSDPLRLFDALVELLRRLALAQPLAVLLEDGHWADDMTLRFLAFLGRRLHSAPFLVAVSVREEELSDSPLLGRMLDELAAEGRLVRLPLGPLGRDDTLALVRRIGRADSRTAIVAERGEQVWATSAGNPLIVVETMRAIDDGVAITAPGSLPLPARAREMIARRLNRLSDHARDLVRVAAVIGRELEFPLLQRAADMDEREAAEGVEELVRRRVLHGAGERFDFTHDRIRDVVVGELLSPRRRLLHASVAAALEQLAGDDLPRHCAALGHHYREAERWDKAVVFLRQAGHQAIERCAYREAVALLEQARTALEHLPASRTTLETAVDVRLDLRNALLPLGDFSAIRPLLEEAAAQAERLGDAPRRVRATSFLMDQLRMAGEYDGALRHGQHALALAEGLGDPVLRILIGTRLAQVYHLRGEYQPAVALFRRSLELATGEPAGERLGLLQPPAVHSRYSLVLSLIELGAFEDAQVVADEGLTLAQQLDHPIALSFAWGGAGLLALQQGALGSSIDRLERALERGEGTTVSPWVQRFAGALGYAYALSGQAMRGCAVLGKALDQAATIGMAAARPLMLAWLAEARLLAGDVRGARDTAEEAVALARRHGERGHAAWALRARAEAEAREDDVAASVASYEEAITVAGELEMRPLLACCRFGLGVQLARAGRREPAAVELAAACDLFADMGMELGRAGAERALAGLA
jgi:DNA-binding SARP family transcriptional activator